jgi:hypothetical protein
MWSEADSPLLFDFKQSSSLYLLSIKEVTMHHPKPISLLITILNNIHSISALYGTDSYTSSGPQWPPILLMRQYSPAVDGPYPSRAAHVIPPLHTFLTQAQHHICAPNYKLMSVLGTNCSRMPDFALRSQTCKQDQTVEWATRVHIIIIIIIVIITFITIITIIDITNVNTV